MARNTIPTPEAVDAGRVGMGREGRVFTAVTVDGTTYAVGRSSGKAYRVCGKCEGRGLLPHYAGIYDGICFQCAGTGSDKTYASVEAAQKAARTRLVSAARRDRKTADEAAAKEAEGAAWREANPVLAATLTAMAPTESDREPEYVWQDFYAEVGDFLGGMVNRVANLGWALTDKQTEAAERAVRDYADRKSAAAETAARQRYAGDVGDTVEVTGEVVVKTYIEPRNYGWAGSWLVVVAGTGADDGVTVKMFGSGKALADVAKGDRVTVTGPVKEHAEYDGAPQTVVGPRPRVKVIEEATA